MRQNDDWNHKNHEGGSEKERNVTMPEQVPIRPRASPAC